MDDELLLPVLRQRWSPREFDRDHTLTVGHVQALLEAARWAPSAGNSQPWAFHAIRRDQPGWSELVACLTGGSRRWAAHASLLVVNLCHQLVEDTDWPYSEFASYDLGQAVAHLTIQAHGMGLGCRQFRAFDKDALSRHLEVPSHWEILTMTAIGKPAPAAAREAGAGQRAASINWPRNDP